MLVLELMVMGWTGYIAGPGIVWVRETVEAVLSTRFEFHAAESVVYSCVECIVSMIQCQWLRMCRMISMHRSRD